MSILLAVIALSLLSIAESLKTTAKTRSKEIKLFRKDFYTDKQLEKNLGEAFFHNTIS